MLTSDVYRFVISYLPTVYITIQAKPLIEEEDFSQIHKKRAFNRSISLKPLTNEFADQSLNNLIAHQDNTVGIKIKFR